jgi:hypothetical protein
MPRKSPLPTLISAEQTVRANSNRLAGLRSKRKRASCCVAFLSYTSTCMAYFCDFTCQIGCTARRPEASECRCPCDRVNDVFFLLGQSTRTTLCHSLGRPPARKRKKRGTVDAVRLSNFSERSGDWRVCHLFRAVVSDESSPTIRGGKKTQRNASLYFRCRFARPEKG